MRTLLLVLFVLFSSGCLRMCADAEETAYQEFRPKNSLRKYEWFKDAAAQLGAMRADIEVYRARMDALDATYESASRLKWARSDVEQYNVWSSELAGVRAAYNGLAAEYNASMSKFNWAYAAGEEPLPREFRVYVTQ
jgi:hypothetical protein